MASLLMNPSKFNNELGSLGFVALTIPSNNEGSNHVVGPGPNDYYSLDEYIAAVLFEVFLYGIYVTLFAICIRVLLKNRRTTQGVLLASAITMFSLATVDVALELSFLFRFVVKGKTIPDSDLHLKSLIYITSNIIADSLVIYRCHSIWDNSKRIIILPVFLLIGGSACAYAFIALSKGEYRLRQLFATFLFTTAILNMLVTVLMAGRIWWIARKARSILGPSLSSKYSTVIAIIVESGVIYSVYVVLDLVFPNLIIDAGLAQVVGIVPTLLIVQIKLGREPHDVDTVTVVRSDARAFTTIEDNDRDGPPTGPPPAMLEVLSPSIPPLTLTNQRTRSSRLPESYPRVDTDRMA